MRKFLDKLSNEVQGTINQAGNWSGYANPGGSGGGRGYGYPAPGGGFGQPAAAVPHATTPCPRQQPQAGHQDWIGLGDARFATFNVCPSCYNSVLRPTPYAGAFVTKAGAIAPPPNIPVRCDMSRYWVRVAGMVLLTMNHHRQHDITLLARVAGIRAQDGDCPNTDVAAEHQPLPVVRRTWYTIQDPTTGTQPLPGWTICAACVIALQTCCPAVAPAFAQVQPLGPRDASCGMVPSDRYDDARTGAVLQQVGACAVLAATTGRADMAQLLGWLRANPPPLRNGMGAPGGVGAGIGMGMGGPGGAGPGGPGTMYAPQGPGGPGAPVLGGLGLGGPGTSYAQQNPGGPGAPGSAGPGLGGPGTLHELQGPGTPGAPVGAGSGPGLTFQAPQAPGAPSAPVAVVASPGPGGPGSTLPAPQAPAAPTAPAGPHGGGAVGGACPRDIPSTTQKCHTMQGLSDLTVCEQCYNSVVKPDADRGVELARRFDGNTSAIASGFTCQLYSDRMRRAWAEAVSMGNFEHLRQKVGGRGGSTHGFRCAA